MSYRTINYIPINKEFALGSTSCISTSQVMSQYRYPDQLCELRKGDVPTETCSQPLIPEYRGRFREKPWSHSHHFPNEDPLYTRDNAHKLTGFYNRIYEDGKGQPRFKYEGGQDNKLNWLERPPYTNGITNLRTRQSYPDFQTMKQEYKRVHFPRVIYRNQVDYLEKTQPRNYP